jgi:hypothetical protein
VVKKEEKSKDKSSNKDDVLMPELKKVAKKFKELRIMAKHTSHETFAYENEINRVQYWRVEKGSNITLSTFFKLLKIHNITPEEFFKDF